MSRNFRLEDTMAQLGDVRGIVDRDFLLLRKRAWERAVAREKRAKTVMLGMLGFFIGTLVTLVYVYYH